MTELEKEVYEYFAKLTPFSQDQVMNIIRVAVMEGDAVRREFGDKRGEDRPSDKKQLRDPCPTQNGC